MLRQFEFTLTCLITVEEITNETAERAYRNDPNVGQYLNEPRELSSVIDQQKRLLDAILKNKGVLHRLVKRYVYEYIQERLYDELPKPPEIEEEMFLVIGETFDALDFVDRALYLAYAAPRPEYEMEEDGDPFEQHTRLIRESFKIVPSGLKLTEVSLK